MKRFTAKFLIVLTLSACAITSTAFAGKQTESVTVNNTDAHPVPVTVQNGVATIAADNPALQPFAFSDSAAPASDSFANDFIFQVPSGKRLVIETVTTRVSLPDGQQARTSITVLTGNAQHVHWLTIHNEGSNGSYTEFDGTNLVRLYAEAGTNVSVHVGRTDNSGNWNAAVSISGYLVAVPN